MDLNALHAIWIALWLSLKVAFCATVVNFILGVIVAAFFFRVRNKFTSLLESILTLPMVLPPTVLGYYLLVCFGSNSSLGQWLASIGIQMVFSLNGAIAAAALVTFPLVFKPIQAAFEQIPQNILDASKIMGLNFAQTLFIIILPMVWDSVVAGLLLGFARSLGEFGATLMIAGSIPGKTQTISISIWEAVQAGNNEQAAYLVLIISVVCISILMLVKALNKRHWKQ
ncbi:molybdate ABC transporter permease subunit [Acinetobacter sp. MD2(2019)]|uniref:molybdate ABC transporter permease subunit n=1 Tax=Acinetobacter sp. MD2(2019) TaxID=2605273 RepID=UPI002D1E7B78|nr:molybdate ABC transporter permease subunit [Acinetobacter sp. MD2(2019)]MEB3752794.1 molybdate ABC transporter permease subunit [Acinetobacter sp. MD2(2019)]